MTLIVELKVIPSSGKQKFVLDKSGQLKCYLKSPPEKGKANKELIKLIATKLHCSQNMIEIAAGFTGRKKKIKVNNDYSYQEFLEKLGLESGEQGAIFSLDGN